MSVFAARRRALLERIGPRAVAVVGGRPVARRNRDTEYRFRQPSDLLYLTGFAEPESLCVLGAGLATPFVLFVRPRDAASETWTGRRAGVEGAVARFGADAAFAVGDLKRELARLLDGVEEVLFVP